MNEETANIRFCYDQSRLYLTKKQRMNKNIDGLNFDLSNTNMVSHLLSTSDQKALGNGFFV